MVFDIGSKYQLDRLAVYQDRPRSLENLAENHHPRDVNSTTFCDGAFEDGRESRRRALSRKSTDHETAGFPLRAGGLNTS
jgi:hypothetical protein